MSTRKLMNGGAAVALLGLGFGAWSASDLNFSLALTLLAVVVGSYLVAACAIYVRGAQERRLLARSTAQMRSDDYLTWYFAKWAAAVGALASLAATFVAITGGANAMKAVGGWLFIPGALLIFLALWSHALPNHDRQAKYERFLMGSFLGSCGYWTAKADVFMLEWTVASCLLFLPLAYLFRSWIEPEVSLNQAPEAARRALRLYRIGMWAGPGTGVRGFLTFVLTRIVDPTGYCFFLLRYYSTEKVNHTPLLYLRAFDNPQAGEVASKIVAPATAHFPIQALVHASQTNHELHRRAPSGLRIKAAAVDDQSWRQWIEQELPRSPGVIIDATVNGDGFAWEFALALRVLPPHRIIVLVPQGAPEPRSELATISYDLQHPSLAADALVRWIDALTDNLWATTGVVAENAA